MTADQFPKLPALSPEAYRWQKSKTDPRTLQRRANGTEAWVGIKSENYKGQYDLFLNTALRVCDRPTAKKFSLSTLKEKLQTALVNIRFQHPDIACTAIWDDQGPLIQYTPPEDNQDALKWAKDGI